MIALAMFFGHDPREARQYAWRDLELLAYTFDLFQERLGGF